MCNCIHIKSKLIKHILELKIRCDINRIWAAWQQWQQWQQGQQWRSSVQFGLQDFSPGLGVQRHHPPAVQLLCRPHVAVATSQPVSYQAAAGVVPHQGDLQRRKYRHETRSHPLFKQVGSGVGISQTSSWFFPHRATDTWPGKLVSESLKLLAGRKSRLRRVSGFCFINKTKPTKTLTWSRCAADGFRHCLREENPPSRTNRLSYPCPRPSDKQLWPADTASSTAGRSLRWCRATACRCTRRCTDSQRPARRRSSRSSLSAAFRQSCEAGCRGGRVVVCKGETLVGLPWIRHAA